MDPYIHIFLRRRQTQTTSWFSVQILVIISSRTITSISQLFTQAGTKGCTTHQGREGLNKLIPRCRRHVWKCKVGDDNKVVCATDSMENSAMTQLVRPHQQVNLGNWVPHWPNYMYSRCTTFWRPFCYLFHQLLTRILIVWTSKSRTPQWVSDLNSPWWVLGRSSKQQPLNRVI